MCRYLCRYFDFCSECSTLIGGTILHPVLIGATQGNKRWPDTHEVYPPGDEHELTRFLFKNREPEPRLPSYQLPWPRTMPRKNKRKTKTPKTKEDGNEKTKRPRRSVKINILGKEARRNWHCIVNIELESRGKPKNKDGKFYTYSFQGLKNSTLILPQGDGQNFQGLGKKI